MSTDAAQAAADALDNRTPIVLLHVAAVRGIADLTLGLHATFTPDQGLSRTFGTPSLDTAITAAATTALTHAEPDAQAYGPDGAPASRGSAAYVRVFFDPILPPPRLVVVGAGHVAAPLVRIAGELDFESWVVDDRADYANRERFPTADRVVAAPIEDFLAELPIDAATYIVLVTRAHRFDEVALRRVLRSPSPYIGMIGSRRRVHIVWQTLRDEGVAAEEFRNVYAPIGLDIGSSTPAEIALAIVAEIVNLRRRGPAAHLSLEAFRQAGAAAVALAEVDAPGRASGA